MFLAILAAALHGNSTALMADSLDNLGDGLTCGLSQYAVSRGAAWDDLKLPGRFNADDRLSSNGLPCMT